MKRTILTTLLCLAAGLAAAQTATYRWTDPKTGGTIYSDQPPPPGVRQSREIELPTGGGTPAPSYAAKLAAERYPVVLYVAADCGQPCVAGRQLLRDRGVPYSEKQVQGSGAEYEALMKLAGEAAVPFLLVGREQAKGFEAGTWNGLLDLAGYPKAAAAGAAPAGGAGR